MGNILGKHKDDVHCRVVRKNNQDLHLRTNIVKNRLNVEVDEYDKIIKIIGYF